MIDTDTEKNITYVRHGLGHCAKVRHGLRHGLGDRVGRRGIALLRAAGGISICASTRKIIR